LYALNSKKNSKNNFLEEFLGHRRRVASSGKEWGESKKVRIS